MNDRSYNIGILGGGAAGLFTACMLRKLGFRGKAAILDRNKELGIKLTLTGHGRCNITNLKEVSDLKRGYHEAAGFITPALRSFGPKDTMEFLSDTLGLMLKEEDNNRIFPVSDSAVKVRDALRNYIASFADIKTDTKILNVSHKDRFEVGTDKGTYTFDSIVLCCGGSSFAKTGSMGDSYRFAKELGHTIVPIRPALVPIKTDPLPLSGLSLKAAISLYVSGRKTNTITDDLLFADFGITGPGPMEIARDIPEDISDCHLEIDLVPDIPEDSLGKELIGLIDIHPDTKIVNILSRYIPQRVAGVITDMTGLTDSYAQGLTKSSRRAIVSHMKHLLLDIKERPSLDKAYVTRGGVDLREISRKTFASRIVPGLYIAGEALDIDGISGGYNLQAAMSEAYLIARSIKEDIYE